MADAKEVAQVSYAHADIAIIGGGMAGLLLANMLSTQGIAERITVIENHPLKAAGNGTQSPPSFDGRSTAVSAGSVDVLEQLGLWRDMSAHATAIEQVQVSDKGHMGWTHFSRKENEGKPLGYVVENTGLGRALIQAVKRNNSIDVRAPAIVTKLLPMKEGMQLCISTVLGDDSQPEAADLTASLVILADGADSSLAKKQGIRFDHHDYKQHAIIANVEHAEPHSGRAFERFTENGPLALLPLGPHAGKHRSALVWTHPSDEAESMLACSDSDFIAKLQAQFGFALGCFTSVGTRYTYSLNLFFAREQVRSSLVLMGNAAHFLHPVAGQGFNLALRDCAELTQCLKWNLKRGYSLGNISGLQRYIEKRKQDQWLTTTLSHTFIDLFSSEHPVKRLLRNSGLTAMNAFPPLKTLFFQQMMGRGGKGVNFE